MSIQRDPHLPPPEVCDWLLAQEWSEPATVNVSSVAGDSEMYDHCQTTAELGRDECIDLMLPVEALAVLRADAEARTLRRRGMEALSAALNNSPLCNIIPWSEHDQQPAQPESADPETTLLQRVLADAEQAEISAFSAIGVLTTAATMMVSQCYDLTKLGDDHADA